MRMVTRLFGVSRTPASPTLTVWVRFWRLICGWIVGLLWLFWIKAGQQILYSVKRANTVLVDCRAHESEDLPC